MKIYIMGLGAGSIDLMSTKAYRLLKDESLVKIFRTEKHQAVLELEKEKVKYKSLDYIYESEKDFENVYEKIAQTVIDEAKKYENIIYAVPGNPFITENTTNMIIDRAKEENIQIEIVPSLSFIDASICALRTDPSKEIFITDIFTIKNNYINPDVNMLVSQVYDRFKASDLKLLLLEKYDDDHEVVIIKSAGGKNQETKKVKLYQMDYSENSYDHLTSVFVPKAKIKKYNDIYDLLETVEILTDEEKGCPWDKKQNINSMKDYLVSEAMEVKEAIENDDMDNLKEELGDLLFNIVIISQMAKKEYEFTFDEVTDSIVKKMISRHPHVFGNMDITGEDVDKLWHEIKKAEKRPKK